MSDEIEHITDVITNWAKKQIRIVLGWSKKYSLPGFSGVPIYNMVRFIYLEMINDNISTRSMAVAYSVFIAIFPFMIFLFTLLPYLPFTADYLAIIETYVNNFLPTNAADYLLEIIRGLATRERGGLQSVGILLSLFFSSSGMLTVMYGFDKSNNHKEAFAQRGYIKMRWIALILTLTLSLLFVSSFVLLIMGDFLMGYIKEYFLLTDDLGYVLLIIKYSIAIFLLLTAIAIIYRFGPSLRNKLPFFNTGALVATIVSLIVSFGFSYYVNNFGTYNKIYGSIGALIVIMLWLQFIAFAILIGFEINASIAVNKEILFPKKKEEE